MKNWIFLCVFLFIRSLTSNQLESREIKTLVLIIASDDSPLYAHFQRTWKSYMHLDPEHFECYFIRGNENLPTKYSIEGDTIWSKTKECMTPGVLNKTLLSFAALSSRIDEFDYILRANLSSFFVFPRLLEFLKTLPRQGCYSGIHHGKGGSAGAECLGKWVNGSGMILSVDLVKMLTKHFDALFNYQGPNDDVVIGAVFAMNNIPILLSRYLEIYELSTWNAVKNAIPPDVFHFRIRTEPQITREMVDGYIHSTLLTMFYPESHRKTHLSVK